MAHIEKRETKNGNSYRITVSCGYDTKGKQVKQQMTWKPDPSKKLSEEAERAKAEIAAAEFERKCLNGYKSTAMKFEPLAEEWFENHAKLNLKSTTYTRQRQLTKRVYAAIGHIRLDRLTTRDIQKFINSLAQDGVNENTGKALSHKTMVHYLSFISTVIEYAIRLGMMTDNPCERVIVPKGSKKKRQILTIEETKRFCNLICLAPLKYRAFFGLALYSGMRRGELLGLEWHDIDFDTRVINVQRSSNYTKARGIYTDTPKTENSIRFIKVPMNVINVLKLYKTEQDAEREKLGDKWQDFDRLFVKWDGQPMNPQTPYGWLKEFCEDNDIPFYGIHQFRHLHTSLLVGAGVDPATISGVLGHASIGTTMNVYSHMFKENNIKSCDAITNALKHIETSPDKSKSEPETKLDEVAAS